MQNDTSSNSARIALDAQQQQIELRISGPVITRREMLTILRHHLNLLHRTFADLEVDERVPLPGGTGKTVGYMQLLAWEQEGVVENRFEGVPGVVHISGLLNGVSTPADRARDYMEHLLDRDDPFGFHHIPAERLHSLYETYRESLAHVQLQIAKCGHDIPTKLMHEERDLRKRLAALEHTMTYKK